jgi:hypothetical protein
VDLARHGPDDQVAVGPAVAGVAIPSGANLSGVNLQGATVTGARLDDTILTAAMLLALPTAHSPPGAAGLGLTAEDFRVTRWAAALGTRIDV